MKNLKRFCVFFFMILFLASVAYAQENADLQEVLENCRRKGIEKLIFPADIALEEMHAERYDIRTDDYTFTKWLVTADRQAENMDFGCVTFYSPSGNTQFLGTKSAYLRMQELTKLEVQWGHHFFWTPEQKANDYVAIYPDHTPYTSPAVDELSLNDALLRAKESLRSDLGLSDAQIDQYLIDASFCEIKGLKGKVKRYWEISFRLNDPAANFPWLFPVMHSVILDGDSCEIIQ